MMQINGRLRQAEFNYPPLKPGWKTSVGKKGIPVLATASETERPADTAAEPMPTAAMTVLVPPVKGARSTPTAERRGPRTWETLCWMKDVVILLVSTFCWVM